MMDKETELLVERHRESAFQHGFAVGFGLAVAGAVISVVTFFFVKITIGWPV